MVNTATHSLTADLSDTFTADRSSAEQLWDKLSGVKQTVADLTRGFGVAPHYAGGLLMAR